MDICQLFWQITRFSVVLLCFHQPRGIWLALVESSMRGRINVNIISRQFPPSSHQSVRASSSFIFTVSLRSWKRRMNFWPTQPDIIMIRKNVFISFFFLATWELFLLYFYYRNMVFIGNNKLVSTIIRLTYTKIRCFTAFSLYAWSVAIII